MTDAAAVLEKLVVAVLVERFPNKLQCFHVSDYEEYGIWRFGEICLLSIQDSMPEGQQVAPQRP